MKLCPNCGDCICNTMQLIHLKRKIDVVKVQIKYFKGIERKEYTLSDEMNILLPFTTIFQRLISNLNKSYLSSTSATSEPIGIGDIGIHVLQFNPNKRE